MQPTQKVSMSPSPKPRPSGFTLVELMVVIAIIALLVSILIPVVGRARRQSRNVACLANLRSLHTALIGFVNQNKHSVDYSPVSLTNATDPRNVRSKTWEGALLPMYNDDRVRTCAEAVEPADKPIGGATRAHGTKQAPTAAMTLINDKYSYGSYGINGFLYYQDPAQPAATRAGLTHVQLPPGKAQKDLWFDDITTLDGGAVNLPAGIVPPPGFGGAGTVPAFGDCNDLDSWPMSIDGIKYDPTPSKGGYTTGTGDTKPARGDSLGRFCLDRHPSGVNIVFLDGHARTVPLRELWQLRWNKSFVPVSVTVP